MVRQSYLFFLFLLISCCSSQREVLAQQPSSVVQTRCVVSMRLWCIATGGISSMSDTGALRVWTLELGYTTAAGPLTISEARICDSTTSIEFGLASDRVEAQGTHQVRILKYWINERSGCFLEFRFPAVTGDTSQYERIVHYSIFIGDLQLGTK